MNLSQVRLFGKMTPMDCVTCGAAIPFGEGVCCEECCRTSPFRFCRNLDGVSLSQAKNTFGCTYKDIAFLRSMRKRPWNKKKKSRLLKGAEVAFLGEARRQFPRHRTCDLLYLNRRSMLDARVHAVQEKLGISLRILTPENKSSLFGDYLTRPVGNERTLSAIVDEFPSDELVHSIMNACQVGYCRALNFCIECPGGGPTEFQDLRERMIEVFRFAGDMIFAHLSSSELAILAETEFRCVLRLHGLLGSKTED